MALEIFWSKKADRSFNKRINYLLDEWGDDVAESFIRRTYDLLDVLAEFPNIGSLENHKLEIRGFTITKQINVFYTIRNNTIVLLNFYDNRQNPQNRKY